MVYTKQQRREYQAAYRLKRRQEAIKFLGGECVVCGTTENLEFNHRDPRAKMFSLGRWDGSKAAYWEEILKCELLCHTHHGEETSRQYAAGLIKNR